MKSLIPILRAAIKETKDHDGEYTREAGRALDQALMALLRADQEGELGPDTREDDDDA